MGKIITPLNSVCIDTGALAKTAFSLNKKFSLIEFLDFCSIIEQMILRDALILTGTANSTQKSMLASIQSWIDSGAIIFAQESPKPFVIQNINLTDIYNLHPDMADQSKTGLRDAEYETGRLLAAQEYFRRPAMPLVRNFKTFDHVVKPHINQMAFDIVSKYDEQTSQLHDIKISANRHVPQFMQINFPPIAIDILKEAKSFDDLVKLTLQYRTHFSGLRLRANEIEEIQRDPYISVFKKLEEMNGWNESWNENLSEFGKNNIILGNTVVGLMSGLVKAGLSGVTGNLAGAVEVGTEIAEHLHHAKKYFRENKNDRILQPIRSAFMSSLQTSQPEIKSLVDGLFNYDPRKFDELMEVSCFGRSSALEALVDHEMKIRVSQD